MRALGLLALAATLTAEPSELGAALRRTDRDTARKLLSLAQKAEADGQQAAAAALFARVVELEPNEAAAARVRLAFRLVRGTWERTPEQAAEVLARKDEDAAAAAEFRDQAARVEEARTKEIIRLSVKLGTPEEREAILGPMLEKAPGRADLHEALGHVRVGDRWVSPELAPAVKLLPLRLEAWRSHAKDAVAVEPSACALKPPGVGALAFLRADGCDVASKPDLGNAGAEAVARVRGFLRFLLGDEAKLWSPPPLLFLGPAEYEALVRALHPKEEEFALYHAFENYERKDFYAIRVYDRANAEERYAHGAGYLTMYGLVAGGDERAHAWLLEGMGYLASLELFDMGNLSYRSIDESNAKPGGAGGPAERTRAGCLAWVRDEMRAGRAYALADVCGRSLNELDLLASFEAYSFLRFLFILDPDGARMFPSALRGAKGESQPARVDTALRASFGMGLSDLETLWRLFVVQVEG